MTGDPRAGYLELIRELGEITPTVFVFGGYAEDALLWRETTRDHSDVDVIVWRHELADRMLQFEALRFPHFDVYYEPVAGKPQVLNGERDGLHLEVSVIETDGDRGYFVVDDPEGKRYRLYIERRAFEWPASEFDGIAIQTVSPLMLYQIRDGLRITGAFGEFRPHDETRQHALKEKFFADKTEEELGPDIVEADG